MFEPDAHILADPKKEWVKAMEKVHALQMQVSRLQDDLASLETEHDQQITLQYASRDISRHVAANSNTEVHREGQFAAELKKLQEKNEHLEQKNKTAIRKHSDLESVGAEKQRQLDEQQERLESVTDLELLAEKRAFENETKQEVIETLLKERDAADIVVTKLFDRLRALEETLLEQVIDRPIVRAFGDEGPRPESEDGLEEEQRRPRLLFDVLMDEERTRRRQLGQSFRYSAKGLVGQPTRTLAETTYPLPAASQRFIPTSMEFGTRPGTPDSEATERPDEEKQPSPKSPGLAPTRGEDEIRELAANLQGLGLNSGDAQKAAKLSIVTINTFTERVPVAPTYPLSMTETMTQAQTAPEETRAVQPNLTLFGTSLLSTTEPGPGQAAVVSTQKIAPQDLRLSEQQIAWLIKHNSDISGYVEQQINEKLESALTSMRHGLEKSLLQRGQNTTATSTQTEETEKPTLPIFETISKVIDPIPVHLLQGPVELDASNARAGRLIKNNEDFRDFTKTTANEGRAWASTRVHDEIPSNLEAADTSIGSSPTANILEPLAQIDADVEADFNITSAEYDTKQGPQVDESEDIIPISDGLSEQLGSGSSDSQERLNRFEHAEGLKRSPVPHFEVQDSLERSASHSDAGVYREDELISDASTDGAMDLGEIEKMLEKRLRVGLPKSEEVKKGEKRLKKIIDLTQGFLSPSTDGSSPAEKQASRAARDVQIQIETAHPSVSNPRSDKERAMIASKALQDVLFPETSTATIIENPPTSPADLLHKDEIRMLRFSTVQIQNEIKPQSSDTEYKSFTTSMQGTAVQTDDRSVEATTETDEMFDRCKRCGTKKNHIASNKAALVLPSSQSTGDIERPGDIIGSGASSHDAVRSSSRVTQTEAATYLGKYLMSPSFVVAQIDSLPRPAARRAQSHSSSFRPAGVIPGIAGYVSEQPSVAAPQYLPGSIGEIPSLLNQVAMPQSNGEAAAQLKKSGHMTVQENDLEKGLKPENVQQYLTQVLEPYGFKHTKENETNSVLKIEANAVDENQTESALEEERHGAKFASGPRSFFTGLMSKKQRGDFGWNGKQGQSDIQNSNAERNIVVPAEHMLVKVETTEGLEGSTDSKAMIETQAERRASQFTFGEAAVKNNPTNMRAEYGFGRQPLKSVATESELEVVVTDLADSSTMLVSRSLTPPMNTLLSPSNSPIQSSKDQTLVTAESGKIASTDQTPPITTTQHVGASPGPEDDDPSTQASSDGRTDDNSSSPISSDSRTEENPSSQTSLEDGIDIVPFSRANSDSGIDSGPSSQPNSDSGIDEAFDHPVPNDQEPSLKVRLANLQPDQPRLMSWMAPRQHDGVLSEAQRKHAQLETSLANVTKEQLRRISRIAAEQCMEEDLKRELGMIRKGETGRFENDSTDGAAKYERDYDWPEDRKYTPEELREAYRTLSDRQKRVFNEWFYKHLAETSYNAEQSDLIADSERNGLGNIEYYNAALSDEQRRDLHDLKMGDFSEEERKQALNRLTDPQIAVFGQACQMALEDQVDQGLNSCSSGKAERENNECDELADGKMSSNEQARALEDDEGDRSATQPPQQEPQSTEPGLSTSEETELTEGQGVPEKNIITDREISDINEAGEVEEEEGIEGTFKLDSISQSDSQLTWGDKFGNFFSDLSSRPKPSPKSPQSPENARGFHECVQTSSTTEPETLAQHVMPPAQRGENAPAYLVSHKATQTNRAAQTSLSAAGSEPLRIQMTANIVPDEVALAESKYASNGVQTDTTSDPKQRRSNVTNVYFTYNTSNTYWHSNSTWSRPRIITFFLTLLLGCLFERYMYNRTSADLVLNSTRYGAGKLVPLVEMPIPSTITTMATAFLDRVLTPTECPPPETTASINLATSWSTSTITSILTKILPVNTITSTITSASTETSTLQDFVPVTSNYTDLLSPKTITVTSTSAATSTVYQNSTITSSFTIPPYVSIRYSDSVYASNKSSAGVSTPSQTFNNFHDDLFNGDEIFAILCLIAIAVVLIRFVPRIPNDHITTMRDVPEVEWFKRKVLWAYVAIGAVVMLYSYGSAYQERLFWLQANDAVASRVNSIREGYYTSRGQDRHDFNRQLKGFGRRQPLEFEWPILDH